MRFCILFALLGSLFAQDAQPINDLEITRKLNHALLRGLREDGPTFPELLSEAALPAESLELPPAASVPLAWHEVYAASQPGTVIVASGGRCDDCGKVHPRVASGFVISPSGLLVTNYHVVNLDESSPMVVLDAAGVVHQVAGWIKVSKSEDLALLQLAGEGPFDFLPLADAVPGPGTEVAVLGHPDKNFYFFSTGVVSRYFIQQGNRVPNLSVTAPFAKGSSGGPVLDQRGNVVGIVRATDSIYYTEHGEEQKDFQMVVRMVVPVDLLRKLLESP